jgi:hypothetical protein
MPNPEWFKRSNVFLPPDQQVRVFLVCEDSLDRAFLPAGATGATVSLAIQPRHDSTRAEPAGVPLEGLRQKLRHRYTHVRREIAIPARLRTGALSQSGRLAMSPAACRSSTERTRLLALWASSYTRRRRFGKIRRRLIERLPRVLVAEQPIQQCWDNHAIDETFEFCRHTHRSC